jgi:hypothetical protein
MRRHAILQNRDISPWRPRQTADEETYSMRFRPVLTVLLATAATGLAQDRMTDTLRKGIVEEESRQNLEAAIQDYQAVLAQFRDAREIAATALFRMAECYRKKGKGPEAVAAYQRVAREFADQSKLAEQSRGILTGTYHVAANETTADRRDRSADGAGRGTPAAPVEADKQQEARRDAARRRYGEAIREEMALVVNELKITQQKEKSGVVGEDEVFRLKQRLAQLERDLAAFDAGMPSPGVR